MFFKFFVQPRERKRRGVGEGLLVLSCLFFFFFFFFFFCHILEFPGSNQTFRERQTKRERRRETDKQTIEKW